MTCPSTARRWSVLALGFILVGSVPSHSSPADGAADFTRLVVLGDGFAAGEANGTLFDGRSAPSPVALGQRESFAAHVGAAMGTPVVFPRIEYPGIAGKNQLVLNPGFCEFDADAFSFLLGIGSRVDPLEVPNVLAVRDPGGAFRVARAPRNRVGCRCLAPASIPSGCSQPWQMAKSASS